LRRTNGSADADVQEKNPTVTDPTSKEAKAAAPSHTQSEAALPTPQ
jgi:hypothetical protein